MSREELNKLILEAREKGKKIPFERSFCAYDTEEMPFEIVTSQYIEYIDNEAAFLVDQDNIYMGSSVENLEWSAEDEEHVKNNKLEEKVYLDIIKAIENKENRVDIRFVELVSNDFYDQLHGVVYGKFIKADEELATVYNATGREFVWKNNRWEVKSNEEN